MSEEIHPIQAKILRTLLFNPEARFSDLNIGNVPSDHFTFHLKRLISLGLVEKDSRNKYQLTVSGKEFANRFDTDKVVLERQAKIGVLVCAVKKEGKIKKYLSQQRLKQPYYGFCGFITGKVKWGETILETADREFQEESGLTGGLTLVGIKHKMDYSKEGNLLEDKYFFVFRAENTGGNLVETFEGGRNIWLSEKEILELPNLFDGVDETIMMVSQNKLIFSETKYTVSGY